ncbi:MAG: hypothetical protein C4520_19035 [Candidatus Abyssobacteria bacterium SURF_5]|uniref:Uncharacterized protein n=1 Tax=Abyssobacteria bacterium (strain SURF_5) TaxID=2093360 RepID=A0A3A4NLQ7_ABYX5|nr:MAG: hypothetical protein C4520_19035 [Candidatus Abyssubacteria bacterium SURF_5]
MKEPFEIYVNRINDILEHVIAPEIESDYIRGQVFAVIELLSQLQGRIEHRHDFIVQDIESGRETIRMLISALSTAGVPVPADICGAAQPLNFLEMTGLQLRDERERIERTLSKALDIVHERRSEISDPEAIERAALEQIQQGIFRDLMLFRPQRFERISRSKRKGDSA